jgi:hypothetical protein
MTVDEAVDAAVNAATWDARIAVIRLIPERFGLAAHQGVYSAIARRVYVPNLAPDFAYVHWRDDYELAPLQSVYDAAAALTGSFSNVDVVTLRDTIRQEPTSLRVFRLILGFTAQEFAASTRLVAEDMGIKPLSVSTVRSIESGRAVKEPVAECCARLIDRAMKHELFGDAPNPEVRLKTEKPDTVEGWDTIRQYASHGVPLSVFLHQRMYGGAFRQLLDATSTERGDILEDAVETLFKDNGVPHIRTGSDNQEEIERRFSLTVKPAPDFVVFGNGDTVRAMLECKGANDGGTARDKAARFNSLRKESIRLGGVPLFAVLAGLGWTRTADALVPVVRDTDGRVFTIPTLNEMLTVQPFTGLLAELRWPLKVAETPPPYGE